MPKGIIKEGYRQALYAVIYGDKQYLTIAEEYNDTGDLNFIGDNNSSTNEVGTIIVQTEDLGPEEILQKKMAFENLSSEAVEIIKIILNAPEETLVEILSPKHKKFSKRKIRNYISKIWNSKFITNVILEELRNWANQL